MFGQKCDLRLVLHLEVQCWVGGRSGLTLLAQSGKMWAEDGGKGLPIPFASGIQTGTGRCIWVQRHLLK